MSETSVLLGLSHSLEILSHTGVKLVGNKLSVCTVSWVLLSVQEPLWDVVIGWSRDDVTDLLNLLVSDFTGSLVAVDLGDLQREEGESSTETPNLSEAEWGLLFTVQVGVLHTKNVLEVVWIRKN
jgi:hypothetical protein